MRQGNNMEGHDDTACLQSMKRLEGRPLARIDVKASRTFAMRADEVARQLTLHVGGYNASHANELGHGEESGVLASHAP